MTAEELRQLLNNTYNTEDKPFPETLEVDADTYANVCQYTFSTKSIKFGIEHQVKVWLGKNDGILYKGVELILREDKS